MHEKGDTPPSFKFKEIKFQVNNTKTGGGWSDQLMTTGSVNLSILQPASKLIKPESLGGQDETNSMCDWKQG